MAHRGGQGDGIISKKGHQNGRQSTREAGCDKNGTEIHSRSLEDGRLDHDDVGHRHECRDACKDLGPDVGAQFCKLEPSLEYFVAHLWHTRRDFVRRETSIRFPSGSRK